MSHSGVGLGETGLSVGTLVVGDTGWGVGPGVGAKVGACVFVTVGGEVGEGVGRGVGRLVGRGVGGLVLATQSVGDDRGKTAQNNAFRVDQDPFLVDIRRRRGKGFHLGISHIL